MTANIEANGDNAVMAWFGAGFEQLHPRLQALHRHSGKLSGPVDFCFGPGVAGMLGRRLARHLGIPDLAGAHQLEVGIGHDASTMSWDRRFDHACDLRSIFRPIGRWPDGHWTEHTDPMQFTLNLAVIDGGWHWRIIGARWRGVPLPLWLLPRVTAYKRIEAEKYRFHVGFALPLVGEVFSYSGLLELGADG